MAHISIKHLGPITQFDMEIRDFCVFTGPQSNGKSTIAKAIFYFKTIKQDILNIIMQGGPAKFSGEPSSKWLDAMKQQMKEKFLQIFGTSWNMPNNMEMHYIYDSRQKYFVTVTLNEDYQHFGRNYVNISFSQDFIHYLNDLDYKVFTDISANQKNREADKIAEILEDPYETVFIPAGRNLITLLSEQLNYIFTSLEGSQLRNIDYVTKRYIELILKIKPAFSRGMKGYFEDAENSIELSKKIKGKKPAIKLLMKRADTILNGQYQYVDGEERLYLPTGKYVKMNFASSGQQEIVWVFNLLFYYLVENRRVYLILEEPESHLYPESQQAIGEVLGLFLNQNNAVLVTTHSPYLLGTFNYMLLAGQSNHNQEQSAKKILHKQYWLNAQESSAYYIRNGYAESAIDSTEDVILIKNELIDKASENINENSDKFITLSFGENEDANYD